MRCDKVQNIPIHQRRAPCPSICWWDLSAVLSQRLYGAGVAAPPSTISPFSMGLPYSALLLITMSMFSPISMPRLPASIVIPAGADQLSPLRKR
jgi:hypothetical protein